MVNRFFTLILMLSFLRADLFDFEKLKKAEELYDAKDYNASAQILVNMHKDTPVYNYNIASNYYKTKRYRDALKYYKRAFGDGVDELARLYNIGNCYFKLNELDNAIIAYKTALKVREDEDVLYNLKQAINAKKVKKTKPKEQKKKHKKKKKEKQGKSKKKRKKLSKKELKKLKELQKKRELNKKLKKMIKRSFKDRKVPVLMYRIKEGNSKTAPKNPW